MPTTETVIDKIKVLGLIVIAVIAALLLVSPDSYLHDLFIRVDSAWFYLCG